MVVMCAEVSEKKNPIKSDNTIKPNLRIIDRAKGRHRVQNIANANVEYVF